MGWNNHPAGSIAALVGEPIRMTPEMRMQKRMQEIQTREKKELYPTTNHLDSLLQNPEKDTEDLVLPTIPQGAREAIIRSKIADSINEFISNANAENRSEANSESNNDDRNKPSIIQEGRLPEFSPDDLVCLATGDISTISREGRIALAMYKNDITILFERLTEALRYTTKETAECPDMRRFVFTDHKKRAIFIFPVSVFRIDSRAPTILNLPSAVTCAFDTKTGNLTLIEWGDTFDKHLHEEPLRQYDDYSNKAYEMFHGETNPVKQQVKDILRPPCPEEM